MEASVSSKRRVYANAPIKWGVVPTGLLAVFGTAPFLWARGSAAYLVTGYITFTLGLFYLWRSIMFAMIRVRKDGIVVHKFARTRRFTWSEISSFDTQQRYSGYGQLGRSLIIKFNDGRVIRDGELFSRTKKGATGPTWVESAARELNEHLAAAHHLSG